MQLYANPPAPPQSITISARRNLVCQLIDATLGVIAHSLWSIILPLWRVKGKAMNGSDRRVLAFLTTPLLVPAILMFWVAEPLTLIFDTAVGYGGMLVIGVPAYLLLRQLNLTAFWIAPVVGFGIGLVMSYVATALFALMFDGGITGARTALAHVPIRDAVTPGGFIGAAIGTVFWLIVRHTGR